MTRVVLRHCFMVFFTPVITRSQVFSAAATNGFYQIKCRRKAMINIKFPYAHQASGADPYVRY